MLRRVLDSTASSNATKSDTSHSFVVTPAERRGGLIYLNVDPLFAQLRSDVRFENLVRRVGLPAVWQGTPR